MKKKRIIILLIASFLATILVFRGVRNLILGKKESKPVLSEVPAKVEFTRHIAPIIFDHCTQCHRQGAQAPFNLESFSDVMRKKRTIVKVIKEGVMPPWPADPDYSHFIGENTLTEVEKETIYRWEEQGFEKGPDAAMPAPPDFNEYSMIGEPDLTLHMDSILVKGNNRDRFLAVKVPGEIERDTYVRSIEFVPGKEQLVHHLNGHLLNYDPSLKANVFEGTRVADVELPPEKFTLEFNALMLDHDDGTKPQLNRSAVNYLPGVIGTKYPEGIGGFKLSKKFVLLANDMHYAPITKDKWDQGHYNIFFSEGPPQRPLRELSLGTNGVSPVRPHLDIPPDSILKVQSRYRTPEDISVLTINPHMHLLGVDFKAFAVTMEGDTIPLIRIPRWDFRWQYFYTFEKIMKIPKGAVIVAEGTYDNRASNPNNPYDPPRRVIERLERDGALMRTTDEMFQFIITFLDYQDGDENVSLYPN